MLNPIVDEVIENKYNHKTNSTILIGLQRIAYSEKLKYA